MRLVPQNTKKCETLDELKTKIKSYYLNPCP